MALHLPSPPVNGFHAGPAFIHFYGLMYVIGITAALLITQRRWKAQGGDPALVGEVALWAVPAGIIGGRIYFDITTPKYIPHHWYGLFAVWDGGLGIWGAIALAAVVGAWRVRRHGASPVQFMDAVAPALLVAQAIGRIGNYFNQELFGGPTTLPWGLEIAPQFRPAGYARYATFQPTFLYMSSSSTWHWPPPWSGWAITAPSGRPGCSRCTSPGTRRSGCSRSRCAPTLPSTSSGCG
jgi:prolipoprotein diacylglyceryl transferase